MLNIIIKDKYDFEEFVNVLLKNGYTVNATAEVNIEDDEDSESQDEMTLSIIKSISDDLKIAQETKECLWSFYWDCGRQGDVEGIFKATKEEIEKAIGQQVYFCEILGKHSEVYGTLEKDECTLISDDPLVVMNSVESGYNPLHYINDEDED